VDHINELSAILKELINWNKPRINCLTQLIINLFLFRTVNLSELAVGFCGNAQTSSNYRRIQRFFQQVSFPSNFIAKLAAILFPPGDKGWYLSLDRTNWKFGKCNINILMISITMNGIAIPLFWKLLNKRGNSNCEERVEIFKNFISLFGKEKIRSVLMDREFIGYEWLTWLDSNDIRFTVRIKHNIKILSNRGRSVYVRYLFKRLPAQHSMLLRNRRMIYGINAWCAGMRLESGEWLITLTNHDPNDSLERYAKRWGIEILFGCLKTRGFNFESTHLSSPDKLNTLICLLCIAFCWAYKIGEWKSTVKQIRIKSHGRQEKSIFRLGLDCIRMAIATLHTRYDQFKEVMQRFWEPISGMNFDLMREL